MRRFAIAVCALIVLLAAWFATTRLTQQPAPSQTSSTQPPGASVAITTASAAATSTSPVASVSAAIASAEKATASAGSPLIHPDVADDLPTYVRSLAPRAQAGNGRAAYYLSNVLMRCWLSVSQYHDNGADYIGDVNRGCAHVSAALDGLPDDSVTGVRKRLRPEIHSRSRWLSDLGERSYTAGQCMGRCRGLPHTCNRSECSYSLQGSGIPLRPSHRTHRQPVRDSSDCQT